MPLLKCDVCGRDIPLNEGYFEGEGKVYCEKCYADKRWKEVNVEVKKQWGEQIKLCWYSWIKEAKDEKEKEKRKELVKKLKVPAELEKELDEL